MRIIRLLGSIALWIGACLGVIAGGVWVAGQLGYVKPMVVISGSMQPEIMTGDLLIDRPMPTEDVEVGDVLSLPSGLTGKPVTHRVVDIRPLDADLAASLGVDLDGTAQWQIRMKGDDNDDEDLEPYVVGDEVLTPWIRIPQGGKVVSKIMEPAVAMPVLLALIALLGLSLLGEEPRKKVRRVIRKVTFRDPRVDELDEALAAVGVDVAHLQQMDDLDLQLYALGIDVADPASAPDGRDEPDLDLEPVAVNDRGFEDGLAGMAMPASDGLELVPTPGVARPRSVDAPTGRDPGTRSPARSG